MEMLLAYGMLLVIGIFVWIFAPQIDSAAAFRGRKGPKRARLVSVVLICGGLLGLVVSYLR